MSSYPVSGAVIPAENIAVDKTDKSPEWYLQWEEMEAQKEGVGSYTYSK